VLGRSWVTKGGSGVRRSSAEECGHADNKSSDFSSFLGGVSLYYLVMRLAFNFTIDGLIRVIEIQQAGRLLHHQGSIV
jgi:hypothetical protein